MLKAAPSQTRRHQSSREHLDVLRGELDQSFRETKMASEDDLTSAAIHFCLSLYSFTSLRLPA